MTPESVLRSCPGVRYTELAGAPILYAPIDGLVHRLSPGAARFWAGLDGRRLAELADPPPIELARRLRVLGLIEDDRGPDVGDEPNPPDDTDLAIVTLPGRLMERSGGGVGVRLDPTRTGRATEVVEIERATGRARPGNQPVVAITVVDTGVVDPSGHRADQSVTSNGLEPFDALQALTSVLPRSWFGPIDALDRLADLVDLVPVELEPPQDAPPAGAPET